jgi:S1-C subfamily serine protease
MTQAAATGGKLNRRRAVACGLAVCLGSMALTARAATSALETRSRALERAHAAVFSLEVQAVDGARSAQTLGEERQGSAVLISDDGVLLTAGYLVLEAETVTLVSDAGARLPARVLAYDVATGFGLVQALAPLGRAPVPLAKSAPNPGPEPLTAISAGDEAEVLPVTLVSRRAFSGNWEYHVETALYTSPPLDRHSGAALFNTDGELLGIGSLALPDVQPGPARQRMPGNLFVPVELLRPVLAELRSQGRSAASARPWLGLNCAEQAGELRVLRVADDSPADVAGLQTGDRITRIDGRRVAALSQLWLGLWADPRPQRAVELEIERGGRLMTITVHAVDRAATLARATGI